MVSLWRNLKSNIKKNNHRLYSLAGAVFLFLLFFLLTEIVNGHSLCLFYNVFKIKCIGCGMTRAFISILYFDFADAVNYNLFSIPLFFGIVFYCALLTVDILLGKELITSFESILSKKYMYPVYFVLFLTLIILNYL